MVRPPPPHSAAAHAAIAAELVRLCLGGKPERPELQAPVLDDRTQTRRTRRTTRRRNR